MGSEMCIRDRIDAHADDPSDSARADAADWYAEACTDAGAFEHHKNIVLLLYTDDKLRRQFKHAGRVNYDVNRQHTPTAKCLLLREMIAVMNSGSPVQLKPHDLTLRQSDYDEDEPVDVPDEAWMCYRHHKRTQKTEKPQTRKELMMCIFFLAKELCGARFIQRSETSKHGKKCFNFHTTERAVATTIELINWRERDLGDIEQEVVQKYDLERRKQTDPKNHHHC